MGGKPYKAWPILASHSPVQQLQLLHPSHHQSPPNPLSTFTFKMKTLASFMTLVSLSLLAAAASDP